MIEPEPEMRMVSAAETDLTSNDSHVSIAQLGDLVRKTRDMIRCIDNARDAALLTRRANALESVLDSTLKRYQHLEAEQFELKQEAAETHLRTQRRAGELLIELVKHRGGRPRTSAISQGAAGDKATTLRELGIDTHESHRWQRIARLPAEAFEQYLAECRDRRRELTSSAVLTLANRWIKEEAEASDLNVARRRHALVSEYERTARHVDQIIWLDPQQLAARIEPDQVIEILERTRRWSRWVGEFESALEASSTAVVAHSIHGPGQHASPSRR